jgi:hypothetical protein
MSAERHLAIDRMFGEFDVPAPDGDRWILQVEELAHQIRRVIERNRDVAPSWLDWYPVGRTALEFYDRSLALLRAGGLPDAAAAPALQLLWAIAIGATTPEGQSGDHMDDAVLAMVSRYFESLPRDRFPNLVAMAPQIARVDPEQRFRLMVELFTAGLARVGEHR